MTEIPNQVDTPYCEAQVGGMMCGRPVAKWGQQCAYHNPDQVDAVDEILVSFWMKSQYDQAEGKSNVITHSEAKAKLNALLVEAKKQIASDIRDATSLNLGTEGEVTGGSYIFTEEQRDLINDFIKELEKQREALSGL